MCNVNSHLFDDCVQCSFFGGIINLVTIDVTGINCINSVSNVLSHHVCQIPVRRISYIWFHYLAHRQIQYHIMSSSDDHVCFSNSLILILYHWPVCHIWCCLLTTNGAIILCVPILDYCTISIKSPSCLFCHLVRLVIALMISYGTTLNSQINAYVWYKSMFHLLKYQLWCYALCEWHLKMLNVKRCQAMLPPFYPQMIVHCHLTGNHTWESTMSTKLYGWACYIPES